MQVPESNVLGWNGERFPDEAQRIQLPDGGVLEDAIVWPGFAQSQLVLNPHEIWKELLALPTWPSSKPIPFRPRGDDPHWIYGEHAALRHRGNALPRAKIWCQSEYDQGLLRYGYSGWQWRIAYATHDFRFVPPVFELATRLNDWLVRAGHRPHNHWIVTRYDDGDDNIGLHRDKDKDFAPNSYFVVVKLGEPREFAFSLAGKNKPFYRRVLEPGTAVFVRCKGEGAANDIVKHGVPKAAGVTGMSGSIVSRCIDTRYSWIHVVRKLANRRR